MIHLKNKTLIETLVALLVGVALCAPAVGAEKMYWAERRGNLSAIRRANLDGSGAEDLITSSQLSWWYAHIIALDLPGEKMYWGDSRNNVIRRANLDGSNIEDVVTGLDRPWGIAFDLAVGKMYWADGGMNRIQRANLSGSDIETLVSLGSSSAESLALDLVNGKMYWADSLNGKIQRANLDGSDVEDVLQTTRRFSVSHTLDVASRRIYWTEAATGTIKRARFDGTDVEVLVSTGLAEPVAITLDLAGGTMYWTDVGNNTIKRANLDGSNIEDISPAGLIVPQGIALDLDCNGNGTSDPIDIADSTSEDCNLNAVPDECEPDCNTNGTADSCDVTSEASDDCNFNMIPDECEPDEDCNDNSIRDICDIGAGTSPDCTKNSVPDECDIAIGTSLDCNGNGVPDGCDLDAGTAEDCNGNEVPDACDIEGETSPDCNDNTVPDECDVNGGPSFDCDHNGIPDECEPPQPDCSAVTISLVPVSTSPGCITTGTELLCPIGARTLMLEIRFSDWDANQQGTWQRGYRMQIDPAGYSSGLEGTLSNTLIPCDGDDYVCPGILGGHCTEDGAPCAETADCAGIGNHCDAPRCRFPSYFQQDYCVPAYIYTSRNDLLFAEVRDADGPGKFIAAVGDGSTDFSFQVGVTSNLEGAAPLDPFPEGGAYAGTRWLDLPADARGTFTIGFLPSETIVWFSDPIPNVFYEPARITIDDCTAIEGTCGDGTLDLPCEVCDDGYTDDCDGCRGDCSAVEGACGDGTLDPVCEVCDDGYTDDCGACNVDCSAPGTGSTCGDGELCPETEICDDGYTDACGLCNTDCTGPGIVPGASEAERLFEAGPVNAKNRFVSIQTADAGRDQAIRVRFVDLPWPFDLWNGMDFYAGVPREVCENSGKGLETAPEDCPSALPTDTFWAAPLLCAKGAAHYMDWRGRCDAGTCVGGLNEGEGCLVDDECVEVVHFYHEGLVPGGIYDIQVIDSGCSLQDEAGYSAALTIIQSVWGDVCGPGPGGACSAVADGTVDVANDVLGVLDKFANVNYLQKARADLEPGDDGDNNSPDFKVNVANDVLYCLDAFTGAPYPFVPGDPCNPG